MVKIGILPKFLYKFQMLPFFLPQTYCKMLKTMLSRFIWQNKKPRIQFSVLSKDKAQGGLAVSDFKRYCNAVLLSRKVEWTKKK